MFKIVKVNKDDEYIFSHSKGLRFRGSYNILMMLLLQCVMGIAEKEGKTYNEVIKELRKYKNDYDDFCKKFIDEEE